MSPSPDLAAAAARDFARALAARWETLLGSEFLGGYLLGSLAHGGFSRRYSDVDMAVVTESGLTPEALNALRAEAQNISMEWAPKLSVFWTDRGFSVGRFPPLDRIDYLDHAVTLLQREHVAPPRPLLADVRAYLGGAPLESWANGASAFAAADALSPRDRKSYLRAHLYPARLIYSWMTGRISSNDDAVAYLGEHPPVGLDVDLIARALDCRRAAADPDPLFAERARLRQQVAACLHLVEESEAAGP